MSVFFCLITSFSLTKNHVQTKAQPPEFLPALLLNPMIPKVWCETNRAPLCFLRSRIIYFGGYGHKQLTDTDHRNKSFIVDEASWVMFFFQHWIFHIRSFEILCLCFLPSICPVIAFRWGASSGGGTTRFTYLIPPGPAGARRRHT